MKFFMSLPIVSFLALSNAVAGGMIGGGEVGYKHLIQCSAQENNVGFSRVSKVQVVKETDFDGNVLEDSNLRIIVLDSRGSSLEFFVTHDKNIAVGGPLRLSIWRHEQGSTGNFRMGALELDSELAQGRLLVRSAEVSMDLSLSGCRLANDFGI